MPEKRSLLGIQTGIFDPVDPKEFLNKKEAEANAVLSSPPVVSPQETEEEEKKPSILGSESFFDYDKMVNQFLQEEQYQEKLRDQAQVLEYGREFAGDVKGGFGIGVAPVDSSLEFEGHKGANARMAMKDYEENDPDSRFIQPDYSIANPAEDTGDTSSTMRSVVNFMFSDEMGLLGMKWDNEGFTWARENMLNQISEHPYSSLFTLGVYAFPVTAAWMKGARVAERAAKLTSPAVAAGKGLFGTKLAYRFDDYSKLVKELAFSEANEGRKLISDGLVDKLRFASPEEVSKLMPEKQLRKILIGDFHQNEFFRLQELAKKGKLDTVRLRASWGLWKAFGNDYFKALNNVTREQIESLDTFFTKAQMGKYLSGIPARLGKEGDEAIYKYWAGGSNFDDLAKKVGDEGALWADSIRIRGTELLKTQLDEGFIDENTYRLFTDEFGGFHLPAIKKGTPGFEELAATSKSVAAGKYGGLASAKVFDVAKVLGGPTTKRRAKMLTREGTLENIEELITDPRKLTIGGFIKDNMIFQTYRMFRDIMVDGLSGSARSKQWFMPLDEFAGLPEYAKKNWINVEELNRVVPKLTETMQRMVMREAQKKGLDPSVYSKGLPVIDRALVEQFFGKEGSAMSTASNFTRMLELLTAVHKTGATALNPPTHMANLLGNFSMLMMAGMNPLSAQALNDAKVVTGAFAKIAQMANASQEAAKAGKAGAVFESIESLMNKENLTKLFGKDNIIKGVNGEEINLAEMFSDDIMKGLIEAQAFESIEGFVYLKKTLERMESLESTGFSDKAIATVARSIAGFAEVKPFKKTLGTASSAYLGEDMIPKMTYAMHLARKGWGRDAIIREVGRRLPQYKTVGNIPKKTRRLILPWITFPAEMSRIIKNNMMDNPINMIAWLQGPEIARAAVSASGLGPNFSDYEAAIEAAPPWAVKYQTALVNEKQAPVALGAVGAGTLGGTIGAAVGGAKGAAVGAAAGAAIGAGIGMMSPRRRELEDQDSSFEQLRAWMLDVLPQSAVFPSSLHPHEWEKVNPFSETPVSGAEAVRTLKDLSPVEPFAIVMPLLELYNERGSFGRELEATSGLQLVNKMVLGLTGFLAPPMLQKYGMKLEGPELNPIDMADIFDNTGGQMSLPKGITATVGGLAAGGLTFLGARYGLGVKGGALAATTALSGLVGAATGSEINVRRLMTDLGIMGDPRTGRKGDWTLDTLANSWYGSAKSWPVNAPQGLYSQKLRAQQMAKVRIPMVKNFMDAIRTGRASEAKALLGAIEKNFVQEWGNAQMGRRKFLEWMRNTQNALSLMPQYSGMSQEYIETRARALQDISEKDITKIQRQELAELLALLSQKRMQTAKKLKVVR